MSESKYFSTAIKMDKALIDLLEIKSYEYITIKELCIKAGVNRSTFYLHYENLNDLLDETAKYLIDGFLSYFPIDTTLISDKFKTCDVSDLNFINDKYLAPYLSYIKDNSRVFSTALVHSYSLGFDKVYRKMYQYIFNPILDRFNYPEEYRKFIMAFYLNGINSIVAEWLKNDCKESIPEMIEIISVCIFGLVHNFDSNVDKL